MAEITAAAVKSLRDRTGLPMMDCKRALQDAQGDEDAASLESQALSDPNYDLDVPSNGVHAP